MAKKMSGDSSIWKKTLLSKSALLIYGIVLGIILAKILTVPERFVSFYQRDVPVYDSAPADQPPTVDLVIGKIEDIYMLTKNFPWFSNLNERILVRVPELENAKVTIDIADGSYTATPGWSDDKKPTLVVDFLRMGHLEKLEEFLGDGELSEPEKFAIANVFLVPGLQALYTADVLYFPGDKRYLQLDNFIQVELQNQYQVKDLEGNLVEAKATVLNVDGYWMVFPGWQGQPDVRYSVNIDQLISYYYLINYKFREVKDSDLLARKELFDEYMTLRRDTLVYSKYQ